MDRGLPAMAEAAFDVLVVGGGIVGAAAARDAALRGLKVGLVEARDFGAGTTGATTRLAHGGLRYLEQLDAAQVREGLRERQWLLRAAPHLVEPLPFLFPVPPRRLLFAARLSVGLAAYDLLAGGDLPRHHRVDRAAALREEPRLRPEAVASAQAFHDAQVLHPERLVLEFALAAAGAGARVANHAAVTALAREAGGWRATVRDEREDAAYDLRARVVLNCAGPWVARVAGLAGLGRPLARTTRGTHVALPFRLARAVILRARDGRTFFAVPWHEVTLVGTTDLDDAGDPGQAAATAEEVRYLLEEAGAFLRLDDAQPCYTTCGVRSMLRVEGVAPGAVPRGHAVVDHAADGFPGLLSVVGGKLTTARATAEEAVTAATVALGERRPPPADAALPGAGGDAGVDQFLAGSTLSPLLQRSLSLLGGRVAGAVSEGPVLCERHANKGLVRTAVEEEWCRDLPDLMFRRTLAGHAPDLGAHCAGDLAEAMGSLLGWDEAQRDAQLAAYEREAARRRAGLPRA